MNGQAPMYAGQNRKKPRAIAFVDYEHWLFALQDQYRMKPDPLSWANELKRRYDLNDIRFFGDFSQEAMSRELVRIRQVSNQIIETKNSSGNYKKDFTDFIMLDAVYQAAFFSRKTNVFILFTGDGHFSSAASFLKNTLGKTVLIYGVRNSFSNVLKASASSWVEIPAGNVRDSCQCILEYISFVDSRGNGFRPTFRNTIRAVSEHNNLDEKTVSASLRHLIDLGYIEEKLETVKSQKQLRVLVVDWDKAVRDGIWKTDNSGGSTAAD